tara:strand:+ start:273 stop:1124 length:852 start_codon:yes stop_codon:yes gene_type:complete
MPTERPIIITQNTGSNIDIRAAAQHLIASAINVPEGSAMSKVRALTAYYYHMNELGQDFGWDRPEDFGGTSPRRIGIMAQDLQAIEPSLVKRMTWLDLEEGDPDYYWVDYDAINALLLDAIKELNARADIVKTELGMSIDEAYAVAIGAKPFSYTSIEPTLTVTPEIGTEGSSAVWTLTNPNAFDGLKIGFKLFGNCNWDDISSEGKLYKWNSNLLGEGPEEVGWAFGYFQFLNGSKTATIQIDYVNDATIEGTETIIMKLTNDSFKNVVPGNVSVTATVSDS